MSIQQAPPGAHVVQLTVHCRWHPEAILYGRGTYDGRIDCYALPVKSHEYIGNYMPTDDERRRNAAIGVPAGYAIAKPKPGQPEHWHSVASCEEVDIIDGRERRCSYHVRLGVRDSQIVEFVKGLCVRRGPSLMFYNVGPFIEDLGRIGVDGLLRAYDELGAERFVAAMNRNWNPDSADPPICRIA